MQLAMKKRKNWQKYLQTSLKYDLIVGINKRRNIKYTELERFKSFKRNYQYQMPEIEEVDGQEYCPGEPLKNEEGKKYWRLPEMDKCGYKHKGPYAKVLSNLFPYEFEFRGKKNKQYRIFFSRNKI